MHSSFWVRVTSNHTHISFTIYSWWKSTAELELFVTTAKLSKGEHVRTCSAPPAYGPEHMQSTKHHRLRKPSQSTAILKRRCSIRKHTEHWKSVCQWKRSTAGHWTNTLLYKGANAASSHSAVQIAFRP